MIKIMKSSKLTWEKGFMGDCKFFEQKMVERVLEFKKRRILQRKYSYSSWKLAQNTTPHVFTVLQGLMWDF